MPAASQNKIEAAKAYRYEMSRRWKNGAQTLEEMEEMKKDNEVYKQLAKEATEEWLAEKGLKKA